MGKIYMFCIYCGKMIRRDAVAEHYYNCEERLALDVAGKQTLELAGKNEAPEGLAENGPR